MGNILKRHGLLPAPERKTTTTWKGFIRTHMDVLVATDFFTAEVWTLGGLVTYYVLFFIHLGSRQVHVAGMTPHPDQIWMMQIACNVTMEEWGFLSRGQYLNAPPDTAQVIVLPPLVYSAAFVVGLLLHLAFPFHILPTTLARGIGAVCVLVSLLLALTTFRVLSRAHTPVDPMKPTTALVTEGPFRYSRNLIYFALTLLYLGVALLFNALWILLLVVPALVVIRYGVIADFRGAKLAHSSTHALQHFSRSMEGEPSVL